MFRRRQQSAATSIRLDINGDCIVDLPLEPGSILTVTLDMPITGGLLGKLQASIPIRVVGINGKTP